MYRVLITADTHRHTENIIRLMENVPFDMLIHLGDCLSDARELEKAFPKTEVYAVPGNNDWSASPKERTVSLFGKTFYLCHGHTLSVGTDLLRLEYRAKELSADVAFFGHTHVAADEKGKVRLFNPGSPSWPRDARASCGIMEIDETYFGLAHYYFD